MAGDTDRSLPDTQHMQAALALARRGLGNVWPNPAVGCVLVQPGPKGGRIVGRGWTQPGGRPHAETEALARAGAASRGAVAYVSLEPCSHHAVTPPCAEALVAAGIGRAVIAVEDPDPRVSGRGVAALRAAGIPTNVGLMAEAAAALNAGFFLRVREGRPFVTLKLATTLDGRIATASGESRWITGEAARDWAHGLRASHDAVMIGIGTALVDDPELICRLPGLPLRPTLRIVVDSAVRLPLSSRLVESVDRAPLWVVAAAEADVGRREALAARGVEIIGVATDPRGRPDIGATLKALGARGVTRVLVEGGGGLAGSLLGAGLVDEVAWFHAPRVIGDGGRPAVAAFGVDRLAQAPTFVRTALRALAADVLETYRRGN
ncbi:MAG TPA: bifunctional diaminohydroxyphosphoribosylaminopyrimidine deaminase/5-amino-6-(5-phosphoribosylamino)uracil reductase RibD [Alphaproteobacteria bacterium]